MKKFIPFLFVSILLFIVQKSIHHYTLDKIPKQDISASPQDSVCAVVSPKEIIFYSAIKRKILQPSDSFSYLRAQPSDFKAHYFYNCKLLSSTSNSLCFFPGGLSVPLQSKALYDDCWKRQYIQYI